MFSDTLLWVLLFLSAVIGVIVWLSWRNRESGGLELEGELDDAGYFGPAATPRGNAAKTEPLLDDTLLDEVIEDEFWMPESEPLVLGGKADNAPAAAPARHEAAAPRPRELIIALYVRALHAGGFNGADIFAAMEQLELRYGHMQIFHHYGLDEQAPVAPVPVTREPVFSIANLMEPGTFEPQAAETFHTPGLILFMRLPGPLCGRVAFELMLNYAHRLAEILKGVLENQHRETLTAEHITYLREGIAEFEQGR